MTAAIRLRLLPAALGLGTLAAAILGGLALFVALGIRWDWIRERPPDVGACRAAPDDASD